MPELSCECDTDDAEFYYTVLEGFRQMPNADECCSCRKHLETGEECLIFERHQEEEEGTIEFPDWYMCERCGEIFLNLTALGYCLWLGENMEAYLLEYQEMTGFKK